MKWILAHRRIGFVVLGAGLLLGVIALIRLIPYFFPPQTCGDQPPLVTSGPGVWQAGAAIPTLRGETRVGDALGQIYLIGGLMIEWKASERVDRYDPDTDTWTQVASLPDGVNHPGVATLDDRIYVSGGWNTPDFAFNLKTLYVYDPAEDSWTQLADMPDVRAAHVMEAIDGRLYVAGGDGPADPRSVWVYDPTTDSWDDSPARMTSERDHAAGAVLDGKLYVVGGRWRHAGKFGITEVYDPATDTWTPLADMPTPRSGLTADVIDGKIHVVGGEDIDIFCTYSEHDVYDPATDTWTRLPNLPTPRHGLASAVIDGRWYIVGGATSSGPYTQRTFTASVDIYTPETGSG